MTESKYNITESSVSAGAGIVTPQVTLSGDDTQSVLKNTQRYVEDHLKRYSYGHVSSGSSASAGGGAIVNIAAGEIVIAGRYLDLGATSVTLSDAGHNYIYVELNSYSESVTRDPRNEDFTIHASGSYTPAFTRLLLATATLSGTTAIDVTDVRHAPDFTTSNIYPELDTSVNIYSHYGFKILDLASGTSQIFTNFYTTGNHVVSGTQTVEGAVDFQSTFATSGAVTFGSTVDITGDLDLLSNLGVSGTVDIDGNTSIGGTLSLGNDLTIGTNKFIVDAPTGDIDAAGNVDIVGHLKINTNKMTVDPVTGNTVIAGTLDIASGTTISGGLDVTGAVALSSTLDVVGNITASGTIDGVDVAALKADVDGFPDTLKDVTATATEINILYGATLSTTELNYVDGVTSSIQTQLNNKEPLLSNEGKFYVCNSLLFDQSIFPTSTTNTTFVVIGGSGHSFDVSDWDISHTTVKGVFVIVGASDATTSNLEVNLKFEDSVLCTAVCEGSFSSSRTWSNADFDMPTTDGKFTLEFRSTGGDSVTVYSAYICQQAQLT